MSKWGVTGRQAIGKARGPLDHAPYEAACPTAGLRAGHNQDEWSLDAAFVSHDVGKHGERVPAIARGNGLKGGDLHVSFAASLF